MTRKYRIYPIPIVKLLLDKGTFTHLNSYGEKIWAVTYSFYIEGADKNILVDTAISAEDWMKLRTTEAEDVVPFEQGLFELGLNALDIDIVIVTHLHLDHFFNLRKCKNAKAVIQEEELNFAYNPRHPFSKHYSKELYEGINFQTVRGDTEIVPGIEVLLTPGHTAGNQSVSIATERGKVVITGFCALDESFGERDYIVSGIYFDPFKAYESMIKAKEKSDILIPLHSQRLTDMNIKSIPS